MSNPTELPDLAHVSKLLYNALNEAYQSGSISLEDMPLANEALRQYGFYRSARRAQPEGEAPQAEHSRFGSPELQARILSNLGAATLSPLCGAQHAESGKEGVGFDEWFESTMYREDSREAMRIGFNVGSAQQAAAPGALASLLNATSAQPQINYGVVSAYADKHRLHFNGLCAMVREAAGPSSPGTPEAPKGGVA